MVRLVWRTDVHLSDTSPASRKDDWADTVLGKLKQVGMVADRLRAAAVLDGGDFFHVKSPGRNTHDLVRRVADLHQGYSCPVYANVGNHDCVYGDYAFLDQQPLGVLFATGVFGRCYDDFEVFFGPADTTTSEVRAYPFTKKDGWLKGNPFTLRDTHQVGNIPVVRVVGIPYHGTTYDHLRFRNIKKGEEDHLVCMAHVLASEKGGTMFEGEDIIKYASLVDLDPDVWCFLPGTKLIDWNGRQIDIEAVSESLAVSGRAGPVVVEKVHPAREVDEDVVLLDVEGVPSGLIPGVTVEHPFWVARGLQCRLPSRADRRCHPDKPREAYPCRSCQEPPEARPEWLAAGQIAVGDYVAIPVRPIPTGGSMWEPGLARLLGYYLAEGHVILNRSGDPISGVGWSFHSDETDLHADVRRLVGEHFGIETHEYSLEKYGQRCVQVRAYGGAVASFMGEHGGRHAEQKEMSSAVWNLSAAARLELLVGWLLGDGHARNPGRYDRVKAEVMGATISPNLASQMHAIALSIGLRPFYTLRQASHDTDTLPCHILSFYGDDAEMLGARLGVMFPEREKTKVAGFFRDGLYWARVRGVAMQRYRGPVYNIRTSTQEYVAGLLLTHNCFGHWHKDQGVTTLGGKTIVNIGSLTRGSLSQDEMTRRPACAVLTFQRAQPVQVQVVRLKVAPPEEVFDVEGRVRQETRSMTMDAFVDSVKRKLVTERGKDIGEILDGMPDVPDKVRERVLLYLERAESGS